MSEPELANTSPAENLSEHANTPPAENSSELANTSPAENPPETPVQRGSAARGVLGALLGALAGVIPWFFVSTFVNFPVGWLGFPVGWLASMGYRKLGGLKSSRFAAVVASLCAAMALLLAEGCSWMYVLCNDPSWQADAEAMDVSVAWMAFASLVAPENWSGILPTLVVGIAVGLLGVYAAHRRLKAYIDQSVHGKDMSV